MKSIRREDLPDFFRKIADMFEKHADELCEMDAKLGDGDLGLTMKKGFGALPEVVTELEEPDIGKAIMKCGMKMSSLIPSTMGFLMGSVLMGGGKAIAGKAEISGSGMAAFLRGYADGIKKRGKCEPGDRTILDAVDGAAEAAEALLRSCPDASLEAVADAAAKGAESGAEATKNMIPKYGKAAVHKDAAKGICDQGAVAGKYLVESIADFCRE